jgi:hypothetical protein
MGLRDGIAGHSLQPRQPGERVPLASMQKNVIDFLKRAGSLLSRRGCITAVRTTGPLDTSLLHSSIEAVAQRHESLRTRIVIRDELCWQQIEDAAQVHWETVDLTRLSLVDAGKAAARLAEEFAAQEINISQDALFAVKLLRLAPEQHVLLCAQDHLISDGTSLANFDRELWTLYGQGARGLPLALPAVGLQFGDYAAWQEKIYPSWLAKHGPYWQERLAHMSNVRVPGEDPKASVDGAAGVRFDMSLGHELSGKLRCLAEQLRTSVSLVVCTVYLVLVSRWCERKDLVLPLASNARYRPELHSMMGFLASVLHLRIQIAADETLSTLLRQLTREFYVAVSHDDMGWLPQFLPQWSIDSIDFCFNWVPRFSGRQHLPYGHGSDDLLQIEEFPVQLTGPVKFRPVFADTSEEILLKVYYLPDVMPEQVVRRFGQDLCFLAEAFVRDPQTRIDRYPQSR